MPQSIWVMAHIAPICPHERPSGVDPRRTENRFMVFGARQDVLLSRDVYGKYAESQASTCSWRRLRSWAPASCCYWVRSGTGAKVFGPGMDTADPGLREIGDAEDGRENPLLSHNH